MITQLTKGIKYIIFIVLFATFLELLLPNSKMQRFIRVMMGLLIMLTILRPVIDIVQEQAVFLPLPVGIHPSKQLFSATNAAAPVTEQYSKLTMEIYKKELAQQIRILLLSLDGITDVNAEVTLNNEKQISHVLLSVTFGENATDKQRSITVPISSALANAQQSILVSKIHLRLLEWYQLPHEKIDIHFVHR